jgi:ATP-binding cassette subfamily F protein 3
VTLLSCSNVGIAFGATELLKNVTFTVAEGERWGIIGRNGAGKSSIFRVITGELPPTTGSVARRPGLRHALLDQHRAFEGATTVWEAGAAAWREVIALEQRIAEQAVALGELGERVTDAMLERFGHDQERFADLGGYVYHARVDAVLQGLGFDAEESKTRPVASLSGGERGRVGLAAQLIAPADLLLLDEPTNHLDLDTTTWLQEWLQEADETVLVVSHDRAFLDAVCTNILHVEARTSEAYRGNYSAFVPQRAERRLTREREVEKQRAYVKKEEEYIRRNLAGVNSFQAKGKRKRLERLPRLAPPPGDPAAMSLAFEVAERGGDQVVAVRDLRVEVPGRVLVEGFTAVLRRNDFVALVGPNGAGKSSLIATLLGDRAPAGGDARIGGSITPAWFRQDLADLPLRTSLSDGHPGAAAPLEPRPGAELPGRLRLQRRRGVPRDRHAERRRAGARGAGAHDARAREPPRARRADQPSRRREHRGARGCARGVRGHGAAGEPRPGLPARGRDARLVVRRHPAGGLRRPLRRVGGGAGAPRGGRPTGRTRGRAVDAVDAVDAAPDGTGLLSASGHRTGRPTDCAVAATRRTSGPSTSGRTASLAEHRARRDTERALEEARQVRLVREPRRRGDLARPRVGRLEEEAGPLQPAGEDVLVRRPPEGLPERAGEVRGRQSRRSRELVDRELGAEPRLDQLQHAAAGARCQPAPCRRVGRRRHGARELHHRVADRGHEGVDHREARRAAAVRLHDQRADDVLQGRRPQVVVAAQRRREPLGPPVSAAKRSGSMVTRAKLFG